MSPRTEKETVEEFARAKINLTLRVHGRRPDGYHEISSLVGFATIGDLITLTPRPYVPDDGGASDTDWLAVAAEGPFGDAIEGENLCLGAIRAALARKPDLKFGNVVLTKNLPVAAGIGGGSADAAAVLRALKRLNISHACECDWLEIAAELGADVPVCYHQRPAFMTGIGEPTLLSAPLPQFGVLLVNPGVGLKTAEVFREHNAPPLPQDLPPPGPPEGALGSRQALIDYMSATPNDLEAAATRLMPAISGILSAIADQRDCLIARMSGSGATCFGLFSSQDASDAAAAALRNAKRGWWIEAGHLC